jgi:hypothetical protein
MWMTTGCGGLRKVMSSYPNLKWIEHTLGARDIAV